MELKKYKRYVSHLSSLVIYIHKINYVYDDGRVKIKASLFNKNNGIFYETEDYIVDLNKIKTHWKEG